MKPFPEDLRHRFFGPYNQLRQERGDTTVELTPPFFEIVKFKAASTLRLFSYDSKPPSASVIITHEILKESADTLLRTLGALALASDNLGPLEVTIWANTRRSLDNHTGEASMKYALLGKALQSLYDSYDQLRVQMTLDLTSDDMNFNHFRSDSTLWAGWDAGARYFPATHPFVWLDSDTPFIGKNAIAKLIEPLSNNEAHFTHANLLLSADPTQETPLALRTTPEKVAAIYGLARRMIERNLSPYDNRGYVEESGLAFTIDAFLRAGGVGTSDPAIGESRSLLKRAKETLDPDIPLLKYAPDAIIGNSNRRFVRLAQIGPPVSLPKSEAGEDYVDFLSMESASNDHHTDQISRESVEEMVNFMDDRQYNRSGHKLTPQQCRIIGQTITRFGFISAA